MGIADSIVKVFPKVAKEFGIGASATKELAKDLPGAAAAAGHKAASTSDTVLANLVKPFTRAPGFVRKHPIAATATAAGSVGLYHVTHRSEAADQAPVVAAAMQNLRSAPDALVDVGAPTLTAANQNIPDARVQAGTAEPQGSLAASQAKVAAR